MHKEERMVGVCVCWGRGVVYVECLAAFQVFPHYILRDRASRCTTVFRTHPRRLRPRRPRRGLGPERCRTSQPAERIAWPSWLPAVALRPPAPEEAPSHASPFSIPERLCR